MTSHIKHTQLTRVGYNYQDLICIQLLIDWYHDENKYQWVKIETDSVDDIKVKSLDDVVALRADGKYELTQVKFTIDSAREDLALDFNWLTAHKTNGTSLLQKWSKDVLSYGYSNKLASADLKTNRVPDTTLEACLVNNKVNLKSIPADVLSKIDIQLKGRKNTEYFFSRFTFNHSLLMINDLENQLHDNLVPDHTNEEGWFSLLKSVMRWATLKNVPSKEGCIYYDDIHQILSSSISREISQYFELPEGYLPPSREFHKDILNKLNKGGVWVVSGAPGMGKSTYLSYLYENIRSSKTPVIRHHYSLQSQSIIDRISFPTAASSLIKQIKDLYGDSIFGTEEKPDYLDQWITKAGTEAKKNNTKIVIIIDGLDHVWRERPNISQLEHLINKILPLPDGISLILGTQPISDTKLPSRLSVHCPLNGSQWITLPHMDLSAVSSRVKGLKKTGIVELQNYGTSSNDSLIEVSEALHKISSGYPLHLIYSLRTLLKKQKLIRAYDIEKLPVCPDGDIHTYYSGIWATLSPLAKEILFMIAITDFPWPDKNSLGFCFTENGNFLSAYNDIEHLVESRRSGVFPFHGSIIVNIRQKNDYPDAKTRLMPVVKLWLESKAPSFWKWGWEWIVAAELGDSQPLINGITRPWVRNALCNGYPIQHIEHIIAYAEKSSSNEKNYPKLVDLRLIKIRLVNGPEYQAQDFPEFIKCAIAASIDDYGLLWRADNIRLLETNEIIALSSMYRATDKTVVEECYQEIYRRILFYINIKQERDNKLDTHIDALLKILCDCEQPDIKRIIEFIERVTPREGLYKKLFKYLINYNNSSYIFDVEKEILPEGVLKNYRHSVVIASCISEIQISNREDVLEIQSYSFGSCYFILNDAIEIKKESKTIELHKNNPDFLEQYFNILSAGLSFEDIIIGDSSEHEFSDSDLHAYKANKAIYESAIKTANKIINNETVDVMDIYTHIAESDFIRESGYNHKFHEIQQSVLWSLPKIAINLYLLINSSNKPLALNDSSFHDARKSSWWNAVLFFRYLGDISVDIVEKGLQEKYLNKCINEVSERKDSTDILCNDALEITSICRSLGLTELVKIGLNLTAKNILGYGYRKDITFHELFEAIQACSDADVGNMRNWLERISRFTVDMFDFTEREINHLPKWYTKLVAKYWPERLYDELVFHLDHQHWYVLEDILSSYVRYADLNGAASKSLIRSFVASSAIDELEKRAEQDPDIKELYEDQISYIGGTPPTPRERYSSNTTLKDNFISITCEKYPPVILNKLIERVNEEGNYTDYDYFIIWIGFWDDKGKGYEILSAFDHLFKSEEEFPNNSGLKFSLDEVFKISERLQGRKRAYIWAVRSIRVNSYWSRYSGSRAQKMISYYGTFYADMWQNLLSDSTHGELLKLRGDEWITVPTSEMVKYLLAVNQNKLAVEVTEVMVKSLENEIQHLPIEPSYWSKSIIPNTQLGFKMLLTYFKWPDRVVRLRCAKQIAIEFEGDSSGLFQTLYIEHLRGLVYEQDVVDFLSILLLIDTIPFDNDELVSSVPYHSIALKEIFETIGFSYEIDNLKSIHLPGSLDYCAGDRLKKAMNGIPHMYIHWIEKLGSDLNYDLVAHMSAELEHIYARKNFLYFDPFNFSSEHFTSNNNIMCSFSSVTESAVLSAYLRTLAFVDSKKSIPADEIEFLVSQLLPLDKLISYLSPDEKPTNWPSLPDLSVEKKPPSKSTLQTSLDKLAGNRQIILGASGPVERILSGVCVDLDVYAVSISQPENISNEDIFNAADKQKNEMINNIIPLSNKTYPYTFGRWETDKISRGFFTPLFKINFTMDNFKQVADNSLNYYEGKNVNSQWKYWHYHWYPVHYGELNSDIGTILTASNKATSLLISENSGSLYLVGKYTVVDKSSYSQESNVEKIYLKSKIILSV